MKCPTFQQVRQDEQSVVLDSSRGLNAQAKSSISSFYLVRELRQHQIYVLQWKVQHGVERITMKVGNP